ncbi:MAG: insulinase family protein, partial [Burkholderiales bacterium]|nr:insulinase family protein [Anaerolineae bacterium]
MATNNNKPSLPGPENITRVVLDNGITILVYENFAAQSVVITGAVRAGSLYETPEKSGLGAMTASALLRGTQKRDFNTIHTELEEIGASLSFGGGVFNTSFFGHSLAEDLPTVADILADALRNPVFPEKPVERLRGEIMTGLQIRNQDTRYRANRAFRENLYPEGHPYHYASGGSLQTIPTLAIEDLRAFHAKHYGPQGMAVVIVGAVKAADAINIVRERLADWQNTNQPQPPTLPEVPPVPENRRVFVPLPGKSQSDIVMGVPGPSRFADDYMAATMVNSVLGQFGMMGRIGDVVREQHGLAYYAYSSVEGGHGPGPWMVSAGVNPANVELALESIVGELRRISDELVTDEDIADNMAYFTGHLPLQLENNEGIAGTLLNMEMFKLGLDY